ncbi:MAG TPA: multiheme c-type cytochrome [Polyangiaceae bacterium]
MIGEIRAARWLSPLLVAATLSAVALASACGQGTSATSSAVTPEGGTGDSGPAPLEAAPPEPIPAGARRDASSSTVVFDRLRGGVWTANGDVGTVSYADVDHQKVIEEIPIGQDVTSVALSPDFAWIAAVDRRGSAVALVDATTGVVRRSIALGTHPREAVWDASDPRWLYVSLEDDGAVAVIDRTLGALSHTVPVGRLPAGLAVSRLRHELAITHRIDASVTLLPLDGVYSPADQGAPPIGVPLAPQPPVVPDTTPNGAPFAFDTIAWDPGGAIAWLPHELLANRHPFQFQRVLFPSVSVVDLSARAEVQTDPNDPNGVIAGRKLLFGAINVPDAMGNTSVVSQPCAAAIHPNGIVAYVVACASEDLLTFDLTAGIAIDLLRSLPGDHPTGMTLDDKGARAFIVSDQSHTLLTLDTAGGSPVGHVQIVAGPLTLVAKDPVDPQLRAGLKLFFRANSSKGTYPVTGNDWMSCGGCHLDGFVSTNEVFFEVLHPQDQTQAASIGHEGLKDMFSTTPTPSSPSFDPHDVLSAMIDQGGLVPDRSGADRTGQMDPSHPPAEAITMAQQIGRVVGRDLPAGPSWLLADPQQPDVSYDAKWCGMCHAKEYAAWSQSAHAHSAQDTMVIYGMKVEQQLRGPQYSRQCAGCHDPVSLRLGDGSLSSGRGITCLGCHDVTRLIRAGGNSDMEATAHDWTQAHAKRAGASLEYLKSPDFCAVCHQQFVPGDGIVALSTTHEWQVSPFASSGKTCVDCHVPDTGDGYTHDHSMPGGNVYIAKKFGLTDFATKVQAKLSTAITLSAQLASDGMHVVVMNTGSGHAFPTGVTDIREPWVEVQALDAKGNVLARYGGPDATGLLPAGAARFGMDIAASDGTVLYRHELTDATRIPFQRLVPAQGSMEVVVPVPSTLPAGEAQLKAVLYYRNVRTQYYRLATGDDSGAAPDVEVASTVLGQAQGM